MSGAKARAFFFGLVAAISGLMAALLISLFVFAYNPGFYLWAMERGGVYQTAGTDRQSIELVVGDVVSYLRGADVDFTRVITVDGEARAELNPKETSHMSDVRSLFRLAVWLCVGCAAVCAAGMLLARRQNRPRSAGAGALAGAGVWVVIGLTVCFAARSDFFGLFFSFHERVFANDLWQLDPRTDLLIRLMPTGFFGAFAAAVGGLWAVCLLAALIAGVRMSARRTGSRRE